MIFMHFYTDINGPQRMNPIDSNDPLMYCCQLAAVFAYVVRQLIMYTIDCYQISYSHGPQMI